MAFQGTDLVPGDDRALGSKGKDSRVGIVLLVGHWAKRHLSC